QAAELVLQQCMRALNASSGLLSLVREQQLELVHALGYTPDQMEPWRRLPLDAPLPLPDAVRHCEPRFFESTSALHASYPQLANAQIANAAWALIPLLIDGQSLGGIGLAFGGEHTFSLNDRAF